MVEGLVQTGYITTGNCKKLLALEGVRNVFLRGERELYLQRPTNVEAVLGQSRGELEEVECKACAAGGGPFTTCVTVEGMFGGSCTNCHHGSKASRCSLRQFAPVKRSAKEASIGYEGEEDSGRGARGRKRKQVDLNERFRKIGTLLGYLAEEFMHVAEEL